MAERKKSEGEFSSQETKHRFEAALRGARIAGPKPMKDMPSKRAKPTRKRKQK